MYIADNATDCLTLIHNDIQTFTLYDDCYMLVMFQSDFNIHRNGENDLVKATGMISTQTNPIIYNNKCHSRIPKQQLLTINLMIKFNFCIFVYLYFFTCNVLLGTFRLKPILS